MLFLGLSRLASSVVSCPMPSVKSVIHFRLHVWLFAWLCSSRLVLAWPCGARLLWGLNVEVSVLVIPRKQAIEKGRLNAPQLSSQNFGGEVEKAWVECDSNQFPFQHLVDATSISLPFLSVRCHLCD
eukprot:2486192-Amphidinium_carterae.1